MSKFVPEYFLYTHSQETSHHARVQCRVQHKMAHRRIRNLSHCGSHGPRYHLDHVQTWFVNKVFKYFGQRQ